jgi:hypothetical protein
MRTFSVFKVFLLLFTLAITGMVTYWAVMPTYVLQIYVDPRNSSDDHIKMDEDKLIRFYEKGQPLIIDVRGSITGIVASQLLLSIRQPDSVTTTSYTIPVSANFFSKAIQLVSMDGSISHEEIYHYELKVVSNESVLSEGDIQVQVKAVISGTNPWFMVITCALGFMASVMQIIDLSIVFAKRKEKQNSQTTKPTE